MKVENRKIKRRDRMGSGECIREKKIAKQKWPKKKGGEGAGDRKQWLLPFWQALVHALPWLPCFSQKIV